ncbi:MAG: 50S ribosomal protein L4 [Candidatus Terrybacteria bacterium CG10_big_fil_rev_8_21_14_0_10_41_10]|uniref:Large ribosomal subunit protein uL4 n=1 Tax=Candidatus Terrybacteria bacterium CG10_big_fil_rev_8_21_14_0_10_41_10 TaxID=1975026 RepID=A0A2M8LAB2_9BACT|nr:MAG: 50S ribosomal protein L4 [Candidatus Terrybacteria bacterium CG10_big_fil_rev_8_21_14_0_10_41_10]
METTIYNQKGEKVSEIKLPETVFGLPWNANLVHQVVVSMMSNKRDPIAHTKGRGDVAGGGRKPWRQKGLGRARHGSIRSPIWVGGGVSHGPINEKDYSRKINKKMKKKAFLTALSRKFKDNEILFLDNLNLSSAKTKEAAGLISSLAKIEGFNKLTSKKGVKAVFATAEKDGNAYRSFKNIPGTNIVEVRNLSLLDVLNNKYLVIAGAEKSISGLAE